jgi:hypothetical protein
VITVLIAYYGIRNTALYFPHSDPELRPGYLRQTVESVRPLGHEIIIGTHVDDPTVPVIQGTRRVMFDCAPHSSRRRCCGGRRAGRTSSLTSSITPRLIRSCTTCLRSSAR